MSDGGLIDNSRNYAVAEGEALMEMKRVWDISSYYDGEYDWRNGIQLKDAQTGEVNNLGGDINTYYAENYSRLLVGDKPLRERDAFTQNMMDMSLARIYDEAYRSYLGT